MKKETVMRTLLAMSVCVLLFQCVAVGQGFVSGGPSMVRTEALLDSTRILLGKLNKYTRTNIEVSKITSEFIGTNVALSQSILENSRSNAELSKQLVELANESKRSSEIMEKITWILLFLALAQVGIALLQVKQVLYRRSEKTNNHAAVKGRSKGKLFRVLRNSKPSKARSRLFPTRS